MATNIPPLHKASSVKQKIALEKAIEAALDAQKAEIKAIVAAAADFAAFKTAIGTW